MAATLLNLGCQMISMACYSGPHAIAISIMAGTASGLLLKYLLDKRYIFKAKTKGLAHDGLLFTLYAGMGLITTAIFWTVEYGFQLVYQSDVMRYFGGACGLAIGYAMKYQLDKRFVFQQVSTR